MALSGPSGSTWIGWQRVSPDGGVRRRGLTNSDRPAAGDGVYSYRTDDGSIVLEDVRTNTTKMLVDGSKVVDVSRGELLHAEPS